MQDQPIVRVIEIHVGEFGDAFQAIDERVTMHVQIRGGFGEVAVGLEEAIEGTEQITLFAFVVFHQQTERFLMKASHLVEVALFESQQ